MTEFMVGFRGELWSGGAFLVTEETPLIAACRALKEHGKSFIEGIDNIKAVHVTWYEGTTFKHEKFSREELEESEK